MGQKLTRSLPGLQGIVGRDGFQGNQGQTGSQGFQGVRGQSATLAGPTGNDGNQGYADSGVQGAQGKFGDIGTSASQQGTQGAQGIAGIGNQGVQGVQGAQGQQASTTFVGPQGSQGSQGTQGFDGFVALKGIQGTQGVQAPQGPQGPQGSQEPHGPAIWIGYTGVSITGSQGKQGSQGINIGPDGYQGSQGPQGSQASTGATGLAGAQGAQAALIDVESEFIMYDDFMGDSLSPKWTYDVEAGSGTLIFEGSDVSGGFQLESYGHVKLTPSTMSSKQVLTPLYDNPSAVDAIGLLRLNLNPTLIARVKCDLTTSSGYYPDKVAEIGFISSGSGGGFSNPPNALFRVGNQLATLGGGKWEARVEEANLVTTHSTFSNKLANEWHILEISASGTNITFKIDNSIIDTFSGINITDERLYPAIAIVATHSIYVDFVYLKMDRQ